jgi:predicted esterase
MTTTVLPLAGARTALGALLGALVSACGPIAIGVDAGPVDATRPDAAPVADAGVDAAVEGPDAAVDAGPPTALFVAPREGDDPALFFDLPWPSDARLTPAGTPDTASFPAPARGLIRDYLDAVTAQQQGFSTLGSVYFRFTHDVDTGSLPEGLEASVAADASVLLVALDPALDPAEARHPHVARYEARRTLYWPGRTLAVRPADGFPLRPATQYAAVLTDGVRAAGGVAFERDQDLEAVLAGDASVAELAARYEPALTRLEALGVARERILSIAVFTTQDPTELLARSRDWAVRTAEAAVARADAWSVRESSSAFTVLHGAYGPVPTYQEGVIPYSTTGGGIALDADDVPIVHGTHEARFALSVPVSPMPEAGYPIVLYSHGTGGNFRSFIEDGTAQLLGEQGYAVMGIDAPLHGARGDGSEPSALFFNILNPDAVRCNPLQAALDHAMQARVARTLEVPPGLLDRDGRTIRFDPDRLYFVGHSQGALVGPLFFGVDDAPRAALFSAGGTLIGYTLLGKTEPVDVPSLVRSLLGFRGASTEEAFANEGFGMEHPVVTVLQGWIDPSDPGNYAPLAITRPRAGVAPRSVLMIEGLRDVYVAPPSMEALATAFRIPVAAPVARDIPGLRFLGLLPVDGVVEGNLAGGAVTGALLQFPDSGHVAFFDVPRGRERVAGFFGSLAAGGPGALPGP